MAEKVLGKLRERVEAGEYYEAHQSFRTASTRLKKQGKSEEAASIAYEGALLMNQHGQHPSASDLAHFMVEIWDEADLPFSKEAREKILKVFEGFPAQEPTKIKYMKKALNWSSKKGDFETGDPELRHSFGLSYWKESNYEAAQKQFLHGNEASAKALAEMIFSIVEEHLDQPEAFLKPTRLVLHFLCIGNLRDASLFLETFTQKCLAKDPSLKSNESVTIPSGITPPGMPANTMVHSTLVLNFSKAPLLNFSQLLLATVQRSNGNLFRSLRSKYAPFFAQDTFILQLLDQIGQNFFNLPPSNPQMNPFGDLFKSLLSGE